MNTGCFDREIKDILLSVQVLDANWKGKNNSIKRY